VALQLPYTFSTGVTAQGCYVKIVEWRIHVGKTASECHVSIRLLYFLDAASRAAEKEPLGEEWMTIQAMIPDPNDPATMIPNPVYDQFFSLVSLEPEGANPISKAYQYLKQLQKFLAAQDV